MADALARPFSRRKTTLALAQKRLLASAAA
jgi:hypothetical protein